MNKTKALGGTRVHHSHVPPGAFVFKALVQSRISI